MISAFNHYFAEKTEIVKALTKIPGIGKKMATQALDRAGITQNIAIGLLSGSQLSKIKAIIEQCYDVDHELRVLTKSSIDRISRISTYRGLRHRLGLPCRGQRTHSNAKTCRRLKHKKSSNNKGTMGSSGSNLFYQKKTGKNINKSQSNRKSKST